MSVACLTIWQTALDGPDGILLALFRQFVYVLTVTTSTIKLRSSCGTDRL